MFNQYDPRLDPDITEAVKMAMISSDEVPRTQEQYELYMENAFRNPSMFGFRSFFGSQQVLRPTGPMPPSSTNQTGAQAGVTSSQQQAFYSDYYQEGRQNTRADALDKNLILRIAQQRDADVQERE